ncbi:MAG: type II toxin-antitoxin system PemK/MazF family toxin [Synergistaceae bacterium]|jgi:mRNA interferase MazF|nr:type II toxin-antitoxin system PemK/MazF family toxin [Synergistaceae bacterium]
MGRFIKGDVVVIPFPFSDLSASKRRPAVILADLPGDDLIMSQITSKNVSDSMAVTVVPGEIDGGMLSTSSNIRPNKLFTADESIVLYKIGVLKAEKLKEVVGKVVKIFTS